MNHRLFFRDLDALDLFQFLDTRLDLLGLGGLRAEAIDEGFEVLDLVALILVSREQLRAAVFFLCEVFGVVALIDGEAFVPDLDGAIDSDVEEVAIVRDEDVTERVALKVALEPVARLQVQMVRGLVEQQQVGPGEQQFGESDAHLPAAAELIGLPRPVFFSETQAGEHSADLRVEGVPVHDVEALLQGGVALGGGVVFGAGVVKFSQLRGSLSIRLPSRAVRRRP